MDKYFDKLSVFIKENGVICEHVKFAQSCHSVAEAAAAVGGQTSDFVKNVCLEDEAGNIVVAIVKGEDHASKQNAAQVAGVKKLRVASPERVLEKTGYPAGGTPSFGYSAKFLVDERVLEKESVWTGGGSQDALVKIAPSEMLKCNAGQVGRIRE